MAIPTKTFCPVIFLLQPRENVLFATHHVFVPFLNLLLLFGYFLNSKFLWLFYLVLQRREEMSLMSATLCSRPTSFLRNQHTAHSCVVLTNLKTARIVKGTEHIKPKSLVLWVISVFKNCQNCCKSCALFVKPAWQVSDKN